MDIDTTYDRVQKASEELLKLPITYGFDADRDKIRYLLKDAAHNGLKPLRQDGRQIMMKRFQLWLQVEEVERLGAYPCIRYENINPKNP